MTNISSFYRKESIDVRQTTIKHFKITDVFKTGNLESTEPFQRIQNNLEENRSFRRPLYWFLEVWLYHKSDKIIIQFSFRITILTLKVHF
jgi:hypothetical protein